MITLMFTFLFYSLFVTILKGTYKQAARTFGGGGGGGGGGGKGGGGQPQVQYVPAPATPTTDSAEVVAAQQAEQQRRLKAIGLSQTNVTQGALQNADATVQRPTLLGN